MFIIWNIRGFSWFVVVCVRIIVRKLDHDRLYTNKHKGVMFSILRTGGIVDRNSAGETVSTLVSCCLFAGEPITSRLHDDSMEEYGRFLEALPGITLPFSFSVSLTDDCSASCAFNGLWLGAVANDGFACE